MPFMPGSISDSLACEINAPLCYRNPAASLLGPVFADESNQQLNPFEETHEGASKDGRTNEDAGIGIDTGGVHLAQQNHQ